VTGVAGQMLMLVPSGIGLVNTPDLRKRQYWKGVSCRRGGVVERRHRVQQESRREAMLPGLSPNPVTLPVVRR